MMKLNIIRKSLILIAILLNSNIGYAQSCNDGSYNWNDVQNIFEDALCTSCHTGVELTHGQSQLSFDDYQLFLDGGVKCGPEILNGTTLVDIITFGNISCESDTVFANMNDLALTPISNDDLVAIQTWIDAGAMEFCDSTTSIHTHEENEILIYPNPAKNWLNILIEQNGPLTLKIYNTTGKLFDFRSNYYSGNLLNISQLPKDVYFIKIQGASRIFRFIKM